MGYLSIEIKDDNGLPLPDGYAQFVDKSGTVSAKIEAGSDGVVLIDENDEWLTRSSVSVRVTAPGYDSLTISVSQLSDGVVMKLFRKSPVALYLGVGAVAAFLIFGRKKKSVRGFADLPPLSKNAIIVGGVGLLAWLLIKGKDDDSDLPNAAADELKKLATAGIHPTITESQASALAGTIVSAADDCGTDEDAMIGVFSALNNAADLQLLIKTYDIREYKGCFDGDYFSHHRYNIAQTLQNELSAGDRAEINTILSSKGINYKF